MLASSGRDKGALEDELGEADGSHHLVLGIQADQRVFRAVTSFCSLLSGASRQHAKLSRCWGEHLSEKMTEDQARYDAALAEERHCGK